MLSVMVSPTDSSWCAAYMMASTCGWSGSVSERDVQKTFSSNEAFLRSLPPE